METETKEDELVSLCEPRMKLVVGKRLSFDAMQRLSVPGEVVYRGIFPHGELPIQSTYSAVAELERLRKA